MSDQIQKSDSQMTEDLAALQKKALVAKIAVFVCFAAAAFCMMKEILPGTIAAVIALMICANYSNKLTRQIKEQAGNGILKQALEEVFEDIYYDPFDYLSSDMVDSAHFRFSYDKIDGNDYIRATYKGLNIEMSDVHLIDISTDEDGHTHENTVFKGLWMVCDFGKELSADVQVCERSKVGQLIAKGGIKTENEAFNKQFNIRSENEEEAFYILTPHMMEYIIKMDAKANARTNLSFHRGGKVHIALNSGRDAFEVKGMMSDVNKIREQFVAEIRQVTDLIDELRLTDSVFKN